MNSLIYHKRMPTGGSDITLKKDIVNIRNSLNKIIALRPVTWHWRSKKGDKNELQHGFIAQEVEKILPQLVSDGIWEDGTVRRFLATDSIMPYLVGAIKEQQKEIEALREQVNQLSKKS